MEHETLTREQIKSLVETGKLEPEKVEKKEETKEEEQNSEE